MSPTTLEPPMAMPVRIRFSPPRFHRWTPAVALLTLGGLAACGGKRTAEPTAAATAELPAPDLSDAPVMLLPVQNLIGVDGNPDAELAFALEARPAGATWTMPDALAGALRANPSVKAPIDRLPVGMFLRGEVRRVGDPLFGMLRRLGALSGADIAVVPVAVRYRAAPDSGALGDASVAPPPVDAEAVPAGPGSVEMVTAVVAVRTGQVLWFGVVAGEPGRADDPAALASAVEFLLDRLLPPRR